MTNLKFYTVLCIFNILLTGYILGSIFIILTILFYNLFESTYLQLYCGIIFYIISFILKLLLPKIIIQLADKYKDSLLGKFIEFIHNNPKHKKFILPFAFCFDLPFLLYIVLSTPNYDLLIILLPFEYFMYYAGGVLIFYIMLYYEIETKAGKIKTFF